MFKCFRIDLLFREISRINRYKFPELIGRFQNIQKSRKKTEWFHANFCLSIHMVLIEVCAPYEALTFLYGRAPGPHRRLRGLRVGSFSGHIGFQSKPSETLPAPGLRNSLENRNGFMRDVLCLEIRIGSELPPSRVGVLACTGSPRVFRP